MCRLALGRALIAFGARRAGRTVLEAARRALIITGPARRPFVIEPARRTVLEATGRALIVAGPCARTS
ncbi:hypothetical protein C2U33_13955, partial [Ralstonia solanacearum]